MKHIAKKITINNSTGWRTDDLRRIIKCAIDTYNARVVDLDAEYTPGGWGDWRIDVKPIKFGARRIGYGWYHSRHFALLVPDVITTVDDSYNHDKRDKWGNFQHTYIKGPGKVSPVQMFDTCLHEIDHCRGLKHGDMPRSRGGALMPAWIATFVVRPKAAPVKSKPTREAKVAAIEARVKKLETKRKRIEAAIKRARRELKYHTNAMRRAANEVTA